MTLSVFHIILLHVYFHGAVFHLLQRPCSMKRKIGENVIYSLTLAKSLEVQGMGVASEGENFHF